MILLFFFAILVVSVWGIIEMTPVRRRKRELEAEKAKAREPFWRACSSRGLDKLPADEYEKRVIGKKVFIREFVRSIPAMFSWAVFSIMPIALVKDKPMLLMCGIAVVILLWLMTLNFYLIRPFALLSGNFNLYGGLCRGKNVHEMETQPDERWAEMNADCVDIDAIRYRALQTGYYYYIVQFPNKKECLFLRTDDEAAESRIGGSF